MGVDSKFILNKDEFVVTINKNKILTNLILQSQFQYCFQEPIGYTTQINGKKEVTLTSWNKYTQHKENTTRSHVHQHIALTL